jgi:hypothetical protein
VPANPLLGIDPAAIGGLVGGMIPAAFISAGWLIRIVIKNRKAVTRGIVAGLDIKLADMENSGGDPKLSDAILHFLRGQEADRQADRAERSRQWERIEEAIGLAREHAQSAWAINQTIQNMATWIDRAHQDQTSQIREVGANQVLLSNYLRERLGGGVIWPAHHPHPPKSGSGA